MQIFFSTCSRSEILKQLIKVYGLDDIAIQFAAFQSLGLGRSYFVIRSVFKLRRLKNLFSTR